MQEHSGPAEICTTYPVICIVLKAQHMHDTLPEQILEEQVKHAMQETTIPEICQEKQRETQAEQSITW